jgi:hypothetical protein
VFNLLPGHVQYEIICLLIRLLERVRKVHQANRKLGEGFDLRGLAVVELQRYENDVRLGSCELELAGVLEVWRKDTN